MLDLSEEVAKMFGRLVVPPFGPMLRDIQGLHIRSEDYKEDSFKKKLRVRRWQLANRDQKNETNRRYMARNREAINARQRARRTAAKAAST